MEVHVLESGEKLGLDAASLGAELIRSAIERKGEATIIVATGASQFEMLKALVKENVDWSKVTAFHLDEYIGIPETHPASFRKYLKERFVELLPLKKFHYVSGEGDPQEESDRLGALISKHQVDVAFIGIGENGHLAFNDPPADMETSDPFIVVELDLNCRKQQLGEGWFPTLEEVPLTAISMSIPQILKSEAIICAVPDERKARAIKGTVSGKVHKECPASVLQKHEKTWICLDPGSATLLNM